MKKQLVKSFLAVLLLSSLSFAAKMADKVTFAPEANAINLIYSPDTGNVALDNQVENPADTSMVLDLSSFQIESAGGLLVDGGDPEFATFASGDPRRPASFGGIFDVYNLGAAMDPATKSFKLVPDGFSGNVSTFANVSAGRSGADLLADFTLNGSFVGGGSLDSSTINIVVPEPSSLLMLTLLGIVGLFRNRKP